MANSKIIKALKRSAQQDSDLYYYALIELPSGVHIPLPIAIEKHLINWYDLYKIPVSRRKRNSKFFHNKHCKSFFRCPFIRSEHEERKYCKIKEKALKTLVQNQPYKLRLIIPDLNDMQGDDNDCENCEVYQNYMKNLL